MKEQEIKKETTPKKKYYKPKIKREILEIDIPKIGNKIHKVVNSEKPYLEYKKLITNKNVGSDFIDNSKKFSFIKSGIRIVACICGLFGEFELAFILLGVAEIFGVYK
jgi:hypothetical protein